MTNMKQYKSIQSELNGNLLLDAGKDTINVSKEFTRLFGQKGVDSFYSVGFATVSGTTGKQFLVGYGDNTPLTSLSWDNVQDDHKIVLKLELIAYGNAGVVHPFFGGKVEGITQSKETYFIEVLPKDEKGKRFDTVVWKRESDSYVPALTQFSQSTGIELTNIDKVLGLICKNFSKRVEKQDAPKDDRFTSQVFQELKDVRKAQAKQRKADKAELVANVQARIAEKSKAAAAAAAADTEEVTEEAAAAAE